MRRYEGSRSFSRLQSRIRPLEEALDLDKIQRSCLKLTTKPPPLSIACAIKNLLPSYQTVRSLLRAGGSQNGTGAPRARGLTAPVITPHPDTLSKSHDLPVPKVSVIIPSYNHAPFLARRIDSVLNQTFQDFELLILDDASTDKSAKILRKYEGRPRTKIEINKTNSGSVFRQWQKGFSMAKGQYIWIAESDDWADPNFLARLVPVLDSHPEVGVVYSQSYITDVDSKIKGDTIGWTEDLHPTRWKADFINSGRDEVASYLVRKNTIPNASAVLTRASVLAEIPPPDPSFRLCGDWLHWIRVLGRSDIAYVSEPLNFWRLNSSNARTSAPGILEWIEGEKVLSEAAKMLGLQESEKERILFTFLRRCWVWQKDYIESKLQRK